MSTMRTMSTTVLGGIRRHPGRALAICVPLVAVAVFAGTSAASAGPEAFLAVTPAELHAAPSPLIMNMDGGLKALPAQAHKSDRPIPEPWNVDGCDHDYGPANVCVPWQIPASTTQGKCAWLKSNDFLPLKVYGTNRQDLPENAEGYVCTGASS